MERKKGNGEVHLATTVEPDIAAQFAQVAAANHRSKAAELRFIVHEHIARAGQS